VRGLWTSFFVIRGGRRGAARRVGSSGRHPRPGLAQKTLEACGGLTLPLRGLRGEHGWMTGGVGVHWIRFYATQKKETDAFGTAPKAAPEAVFPGAVRTPRKNNFSVESPGKTAERSRNEQTELEKPAPPSSVPLSGLPPSGVRLSMARGGGGRCGWHGRGEGRHSSQRWGAGGGGGSSALVASMAARRAPPGPLHGRRASSARGVSMAAEGAPHGLRAQREEI
jgi:hypothetical protein